MSEYDAWTDAVYVAAERCQGGDIDEALTSLGWEDALAAEPAVAVPAVFSAIGRHLCTSAALGDVLSVALTGTATAAVLPPLGAWSPPGSATAASVTVDGVVLASQPGPMLVATNDGAVVVAAEELEVRAVEGIDPAARLALACGAVTAFYPAGVSASWQEGLRMAWRAAGYQLLGSGQAMLDLARNHALDRVQFGRPISSFQAVRHRLAETLAALEGARALLDASWEDGDAAGPAKALAGRSARVAARHCQQVLAGIGFTAEHPFHRHLRRVLLVEQLFGSTRALTRQVGTDLIRTGRLPAGLSL